MEYVAIAAVAGFVAGWLARNHVQVIVADAVSAIGRAFTIHVNPTVDAAAAKAGAAVSAAVTEVGTKAV